jgi:hypothetical protein
MTDPTPHCAVLAVDMADLTQGTVISLHATERDARAARAGYREDLTREQPDLYVIGPVPPETPVGSVVTLEGHQ